MAMQNRAGREEAACVFSACNTPHLQSGLSLLFSQTQTGGCWMLTASLCGGSTRVSFQKLQFQEPSTTRFAKCILLKMDVWLQELRRIMQKRWGLQRK